MSSAFTVPILALCCAIAAETLPESTQWHIIWMQSDNQIIRVLYEAG